MSMFLRHHQTKRIVSSFALSSSSSSSSISTISRIYYHNNRITFTKMPHSSMIPSSTCGTSSSSPATSFCSCCSTQRLWTKKIFQSCKYNFINTLCFNRINHSNNNNKNRSSIRYASSAGTCIDNPDNNKKKKKRFISFITDIEGDALYFDRFVEQSHILEFESIEPHLDNCFEDGQNSNNNGCNNLDFFPYDKHVVFRKDTHCESTDECPILVCGGDLWDKGGNDLYVTRQLLSLQKRYGDDRVHFILGNRDINKMRIIQELGVEKDDCLLDSKSTSSLTTSSLPFHGGVYWLRGSGLVGDAEMIQKALQSDYDSDEYKEYAQAMVPSSSAADRLKWMLKKTMGSPDAFELRRLELKQEMVFVSNYMNDKKNSDKSLHREDDVVISDEAVVSSYKSSTHPVHGVMGRYLSKGKLALCLGGAMFMHGSLPFTPHMVSKYIEHEKVDTSLQHFWTEFYDYALPFAGEDKSGIVINKIDTTLKWVDALNSFSQQQTEVWRRNITTCEDGIESTHLQQPFSGKVSASMWSIVGGYQNSSYDGSRAFGSLCQYGMGWLPNKVKNPTVVYDSWLLEGMPRRFYGKDEMDQAYARMVCEFFNRSNLDVIITGHQPVGDSPIAIQVPSKSDTRPRFIISADTSYSGDTKWIQNGRENLGRGKSFSGRGDVAVTEILMEQCVETGHIESIKCHGTLSDGSSFETSDYLEETSDSNDIGKLVDRSKFVFEGSIQDDSLDEVDWWIKSKFSDDTYLVSSTKGYAVFNSIAVKR